MDTVKLETGIKKQYSIIHMTCVLYSKKLLFWSHAVAKDDGVRSQDSDFWFSGNNIFGDNLKKYFEHIEFYVPCVWSFKLDSPINYLYYMEISRQKKI